MTPRQSLNDAIAMLVPVILIIYIHHQGPPQWLSLAIFLVYALIYGIYRLYCYRSERREIEGLILREILNQIKTPVRDD